MRWKVIVVIGLLSILCCRDISLGIAAVGSMEQKIDSLFVIASSGEVRFRDQNEPAMDSIAAFGAAAVPHLISKFTTKSARERWTIIWTLQRIGSAAVPDLVAALKLADGMVVQRVCWALGDIRDTSSVQALIDVSPHDRWQVREQAIGALGKIGDLRAEASVLRAMSDTIGQVRKAAAVAAGKLRLDSSVTELVHLLGDVFYGARMSAAGSLLLLDTGLVITGLRDSIESANNLVGDLACRLLGTMAVPEAIEILAKQAQSDVAGRRVQAVMALVRADPDDNCGYQKLLLSQESDRLVRIQIQSAIDAAHHE